VQPKVQHSTPLTNSGSHGAHSSTSAVNLSSNAADVAMRRIEQVREKNRRAQAKHREKVKVRVFILAVAQQLYTRFKQVYADRGHYIVLFLFMCLLCL
jgi:hypothetical protein